MCVAISSQSSTFTNHLSFFYLWDSSSITNCSPWWLHLVKVSYSLRHRSFFNKFFFLFWLHAWFNTSNSRIHRTINHLHLGVCTVSCLHPLRRLAMGKCHLHDWGGSSTNHSLLFSHSPLYQLYRYSWFNPMPPSSSHPQHYAWVLPYTCNLSTLVHTLCSDTSRLTNLAHHFWDGNGY